MNKNIEVINNHLWAVKFSFLPYISEINYKPDDEIPIHEEFGRVTNDGLMLLNKDYPGYQMLRDLFPNLMKKKDKELIKEIKAAQVIKNKTIYQNAYAAMLQVEAERRLKERGEG